MRIRYLPAAVALVLVTAFARGSVHVAGAGESTPDGVFPHYRWDWNKDSCPDFFDSFIGGLQIHVGSCTATSDLLGDPQSMGVGGVDQAIVVGDWNVDGCNDMVFVINNGFYLGEGDCSTGFKDIEPPYLGDATGYDYFVGPGLWDGNFLPDLLARRASDGVLMLFSGDGQTGMSGPFQIGTGWNVAQIIVGLGDFDHDVCADLAALRRDDNQLHFYPGDCLGGFKDTGYPAISPNTDWTKFDAIFGGADWYRVAGQTCPDMLGWQVKSPNALTDEPGNCDGTLFAGGGAQVNLDPFYAPFPSDNSSLSIWGDGDCGNSVAPRDAQADLKVFLQQTPLSQAYGCLPLGTLVSYNGTQILWGDWDCNGAIAPRDGQAALIAFLGKTPLSQTPPCPPIGKGIPIYAVR
jgi:hypothetical protein